VFPEDHRLRARFAKDYAARLSFHFAAPAGATLLRLNCPAVGGIFVEGAAVYRSEDDAAGEVCDCCSGRSCLAAVCSADHCNEASTACGNCIAAQGTT
jgi:hypothetical protein